jgi:hypothetical protein
MTFPRPQRLFLPSPPGSLLKRAGAADIPQRRRNPGAPEDADYLRDVRTLPCLSCGMEPSEAAHVRFASAAFGKASGLQKKPESKWVLPLCAQDHRLAREAQHNRNEQEFWDALGIPPLPAASRLWEARGDLVRMVSVVHVIIAERSKR